MTFSSNQSIRWKVNTRSPLSLLIYFACVPFFVSHLINWLRFAFSASKVRVSWNEEKHSWAKREKKRKENSSCIDDYSYTCLTRNLFTRSYLQLILCQVLFSPLFYVVNVLSSLCFLFFTDVHWVTYVFGLTFFLFYSHQWFVLFFSFSRSVMLLFTLIPRTLDRLTTCVFFFFLSQLYLLCIDFCLHNSTRHMIQRERERKRTQQHLCNRLSGPISIRFKVEWRASWLEAFSSLYL